MQLDSVLPNETFENEFSEMIAIDKEFEVVCNRFKAQAWYQRMLRERHRLNKLSVHMQGRNYRLTSDHVFQAMKAGYMSRGTLLGFDIKIVSDAEYIVDHFG